MQRSIRHFGCKSRRPSSDSENSIATKNWVDNPFCVIYTETSEVVTLSSDRHASCWPRSGDAIFANVERVNAELFTLTYGAIVRQLLTDLEEVEEVNKQLDQMGYNIGIRLIDEFLANLIDCKDWFQNVLGGHCICYNWDADGTCCSIVLEDNPLVDFVELPDTCQGLYYCNILSGVVRGALEMVSMKTEISWIRDMLRGDDAFELQVKLLKQVPEEYPYKDDE
ncbi:Transport protein particle component [Prunus dulcis]|uniref:Transport protein particle component n=1 Tax=Prunus dulcis TaxID=3755 RepID=A0A4Y1RD69_PRUDU|nr:Transport protein particle component [Prunus dulcis]